MKIAILALQGAFQEHQQMLQAIGVDSVLIRNLNDWHDYLDAYPLERIGEGAGPALILPGGESTAMMKIMNDEGLLEPIQEAITKGMPTFGTCAGMILLDDLHLGCMDVTARRNAYGRQLGSFHTSSEFKGITDTASSEGLLPMTFIRAPYIERCGSEVEVLAVLDGHIVAARQGSMLACSFHPELTDDTRVHRYFIESCCS